MKFLSPINNTVWNPPLQPSPGMVYLSQGFGLNPQIYAQFGLDGHDGLDIAASKGTAVRACHDGYIIESVAKDTGYGLRVQIYNPDHQFTTIYGHFERSAFPDISFNWQERGYPVKAGDIIGYVDSTGFSTGNHLHLGLRFYDNYKILNYNNGFFGYVDPLPYLLGDITIGAEDMNTYVKTINLDGEVGAYIPLSEPAQIELLNKIFNLNIKVNPDGSITTDIMATVKSG